MFLDNRCGMPLMFTYSVFGVIDSPSPIVTSDMICIDGNRVPE